MFRAAKLLMSMTFAASSPLPFFAQVFILLALRARLVHVRSVLDLAGKRARPQPKRKPLGAERPARATKPLAWTDAVAA